jgi:hypothetical protein
MPRKAIVRVARLWPAVAAVGLLVFLGAAAGSGVPATHGTRTTADEPQYLRTAISLAEDRDLDIADELAAGRWRAFHALPLPEQTEPLASGRRLSPHDPLLPLLLAAPVAAGGWVGAKLVMAALAGLLLWTAVRRFGVPPSTALPVVAVFALSPPLAVYGTQVYPELPAALAVVAAVAALTAPGGPGTPGPAASATGAPAHGGAPGLTPPGPTEAPGRPGAPGPAAVVVVGVAVVALPWLAVKYVPVAAVIALLAVWRLLGAGARRRALALAAGLAVAGVVFVVLHRWWYGGWTPYATGDHFVGGELTAVGSDPDSLGRSRRLLGLATDRGFGVAAWQPAFLLAVPALATLARRRPAAGGLGGAGATAGGRLAGGDLPGPDHARLVVRGTAGGGRAAAGRPGGRLLGRRLAPAAPGGGRHRRGRGGRLRLAARRRARRPGHLGGRRLRDPRSRLPRLAAGAARLPDGDHGDLGPARRLAGRRGPLGGRRLAPRRRGRRRPARRGHGKAPSAATALAGRGAGWTGPAPPA